MSPRGKGDLPLLRMWESGLHALLDDTEQFPKRVRYSFVARIDQNALEILEQLTLARYASATKEQQALLSADQALAKLKVLLRVAHARGHLAHKRYERHTKLCEEAGRMLGGWLKAND
jgi:hypothetical protein